MKLIIAGGRDFKNYELLKKETTIFIEAQSDLDDNIEPFEIVCGMARGADTLGLQFAKEHGLKVAEFPANWDAFKKGAGYIRNEQMAKYAAESMNCPMCICFWDNESKGTKSMIGLAETYKLRLKVIHY